MSPTHFLRAAQFMRSGDLDEFAEALQDDPPPKSMLHAPKGPRAEMQRSSSATRQ
jgi:hypothetical protein